MCGEQLVPICMSLHAVAPQLRHRAGSCLHALPQFCMWPYYLAGRLLSQLSLLHTRSCRQVLFTPLMAAQMTTCRRPTQIGTHSQCMPLILLLIE